MIFTMQFVAWTLAPSSGAVRKCGIFHDFVILSISLIPVINNVDCISSLKYTVNDYNKISVIKQM